MIGSLWLVLGLTGQWLLGFGTASILLDDVFCSVPHVGPERKRPRSSFLERAGLGFVLGIGMTSGILFLYSFCGGRLNQAASVGITVFGFLVGGLAAYRELAILRRISQPATADDPLGDCVQEQGWCRCCQFLIVGLFFFTLFQSLQTPQRLWDERASFAIKGVLLWEDRSIRSRDLADPNFVQFHPRYPLLIPLAEHHIYALLGTVDDRLSKVIFPLMYLGLILTLAGGLSRTLTDGSAWLFALLTATIPALVPWEYGFPCGQADAPMACYHGTSVLYLWMALERVSRDNPAGWFRSALLAGLCGAMAAFTKDEGIAFLLVDAVAVFLIFVIGRNRVRVVTIFATTFAVAATLLLPWLLHRQTLALTTEANYFGRASMSSILQKSENLRWQIPHLASRMFGEFRTWGLQWWLMLFGVIAAPRKTLASPQLFLLLDIAGALMFLMLAGILAATEVSEHIGGSSHRYLMQITPTAMIFAAGQLGQRRQAVAIPTDSA